MSVRPLETSNYLADFDETRYGLRILNLSVFVFGPR